MRAHCLFWEYRLAYFMHTEGGILFSSKQSGKEYGCQYWLAYWSTGERKNMRLAWCTQTMGHLAEEEHGALSIDDRRLERRFEGQRLPHLYRRSHFFTFPGMRSLCAASCASFFNGVVHPYAVEHNGRTEECRVDIFYAFRRPTPVFTWKWLFPSVSVSHPRASGFLS